MHWSRAQRVIGLWQKNSTLLLPLQTNHFPIKLNTPLSAHHPTAKTPLPPSYGINAAWSLHKRLCKVQKIALGFMEHQKPVKAAKKSNFCLHWEEETVHFKMAYLWSCRKWILKAREIQHDSTVELFVLERQLNGRRGLWPKEVHHNSNTSNVLWDLS